MFPHRSFSLRRVVVFTLLACVSAAALPGADALPRPALVVVITIDQFRPDYLERFRPHFVRGGFNLLLERGANFVDCQHRFAVTKTASGHAVILSGVHADVHGIIANDWLDRGTLKKINCVDDEAVQPLGLPADRGGVRLPGKTAPVGCSPRNFHATTVGDELKIALAGRPKVIGLSSKDRSAILLGGQLADAAYWMDKGRLISSTYYMKELPPWVRAFNDTGRIEGFFGRTWDRLLPAAAYDELQGPDDADGESSEWGLARTFPKKLDGGAPAIGPSFYDAFECSPFKSEVLADFARLVVEHERLGQRGVTDLLGLSFSANDTVGHNYGPHSHEVMDMVLRSDRLLAEFFSFLDQRIGLDHCLVVFTADHGIPPLPERLKALNPLADTGHVDTPRVLQVGEAALDRAFGSLGGERRWLVADATALLFNVGVLAEKKITPAAAQRVVADALRTIDFVHAVFTRAELEAGIAPGEYGPAMLLSFNRERSADVFYQPKPFWVDRKTGTNHSTPYTYDTHVPLIWVGAGVKPGVYTQRVGTDDIAPTLSRLLNLPKPPMARGHVLF